MCLPHWKRVPSELRRAVNRSWRACKAFGDPPALRAAHLDACVAAIVGALSERQQQALYDQIEKIDQQRKLQ